MRNAKLLLCALVLAAAPLRADPPIAAEVWHMCKPVRSTIFVGSHYHVMCDVAWVNPSTQAKATYFAIGVQDPARVDQVMSVVHAAIVAGRKISVLLRTAAADNPTGCSSDCRKLAAVALEN